jgi:hypothetical protein
LKQELTQICVNVLQEMLEEILSILPFIYTNISVLQSRPKKIKKIKNGKMNKLKLTNQVIEFSHVTLPDYRFFPPHVASRTFTTVHD